MSIDSLITSHLDNLVQYKYPGFPTLAAFEASQPYSKHLLVDLNPGLMLSPSTKFLCYTTVWVII